MRRIEVKFQREEEEEVSEKAKREMLQRKGVEERTREKLEEGRKEE